MPYIDEKRQRSLRRLMRGEGKSFAEIDALFASDPDSIWAEWDRYQSMTKAQRNRLFANADCLKRNRSDAGAGVPAGADRVVPKPIKSVQEGERRGRGPGKVPAGESFTLVLPPDLLAQYRDLAFREQRSVAQVIRLAMLAYLRPPSGD